MNINEEKEYIYNMMRDVTAERRELTKIYYQLKDRLDTLDKLEMRGLEDIDIKGYLDFYNSRDFRKREENLKREMAHIDIKNKEEEAKIEKEKIVEEKIELKEVIQKPVIAESKYRDRVGKGRGKGRTASSLSQERANSYVIEIFKEEGIPLHVSDLWEKYNTKITNNGHEEVGRKNFQNNIITRLEKNNPKIERIDRGIYQYKM